MIASKSPGIVSCFDDQADPRMDRTKRHLLIDMVVIALCAAICGAEGWADVERFGNKKKEWCARFLQLPGSISSHDTFGRVFARLDTSEFYLPVEKVIHALFPLAKRPFCRECCALATASCGRAGSLSTACYACLQRWIRSLNNALTDHGVRLDGKTLRHSFDTASGKDALQLLNACSIGSFVVWAGGSVAAIVPSHS